MQRIISIAVFIFMLFVINGCVALEEEDISVVSEEASLPVQNYTGTIESFTDSARGATHRLLQDDGTSVPVVSLLINLRKYENKRIETSGKINEDEVFVIETVKRLGYQDETKEAFQSTDLGFRLNYVSSWQVSEKEYEADFTPYAPVENEALDTITVKRSANPDKKDLKEWLALDATLKPSANSNTNFYNETLVGVDNILGIKETSASAETVTVYVAREDSVYVLSHHTIGDEDKDPYRNAFFDMVNSFQFVAFSPEDDTKGDEDTVEDPVTEKSATPKTSVKNESSSPAEVAEEKTPPPSPKVVADDTSIASDSRSLAQKYFEKNIESLVGLSDVEVSIERFEFVEDAYVYITWRGDDEFERHLFEYTVNGDNVYVERKARFTPGDVKDWNLAEGDDPASGKARTVVVTGANAPPEAIEVKEGYRLLETRAFEAKIQYPSNWYWAKVGATYVFDKKPIVEGESLVQLQKSALPENAKTTVVKGVYLSNNEDMRTFCKQSSKAADFFCLTVSEGIEDNVPYDMLDSLVE